MFKKNKNIIKLHFLINSEKDKRIRISISMNPELHDMIVDNTTNKSKYIERAILEYFSKNDIDTSKIKLLKLKSRLV